MSLINKAVAVTSFAFCFREGDALTQNGTGPGNVVVPFAGAVAGVNVLPNPNDANWIDLDTIEDWDDKVVEEKKTSVFRGVPGMLRRESVVVAQQAFDFEFTGTKLTPFSIERMYRTANSLTSASYQFTPFNAPPINVWLMLQRYNHQNQLVFSANIWGQISVSDGFKGGKGELVMPKYLFHECYSQMATAAMGTNP